MFFDWERKGPQTGLAIHAAHQADIAKLGSRASGGCVHLAPDNAAALFESYPGQIIAAPVPRFAYDQDAAPAAIEGDFMRDRRGAVSMADGYRVLVVVEDYARRSAVAALGS